ncbi:MAG: hypothetical protein ACU841_14640 [Gammaproteobacteria bacterium]
MSIEKHGVGIATTILVFVYVSFDTLMEWLFEGIHMSFELFEFALDKLVEHVFHTSHHTTQTIVFYLMLLIAGSILYKMVRLMPGWYRSGKHHLIRTMKLLKNQAQDRWLSATAGDRLRWCAFGTFGAGLLMLGLFG